MPYDLLQELNQLAAAGVPQTDPRVQAIYRMMGQAAGENVGGPNDPRSRRRNMPVEGPEEDTDSIEGFVTRYGDLPGTDSEILDILGPGIDSYADAGAVGMPSRNQLRNREVANMMTGPSGQHAGAYTGQLPTDESELAEVQKQIDSVPADQLFSGNLDSDIDTLWSSDNRNDWEDVIRRFIRMHGEDALPEELREETSVEE